MRLSYDRHVLPRLRSDIEKTKQSFEEQLPGYWQPFEQVRQDSAEVPQSFANPEHVQLMVAYMRAHRYRHFPWGPGNRKSFSAPATGPAQGPAQGPHKVGFGQGTQLEFWYGFPRFKRFLGVGIFPVSFSGTSSYGKMVCSMGRW